jgi:hypothetical protein
MRTNLQGWFFYAHTPYLYLIKSLRSIAEKYSGAFFLVPAALLLAYVLYRAIHLDITYDEAWTIMDFVPQGEGDLLIYKACDANHHLLNTLLIKLAYSLGPENLLVARIPNVLAFVLYMIFIYRISRFLPLIAAITLFLLLTLNPFLLDFFSLARGYGLAMAFQAVAIFYLISYAKNGKLRTANWSMFYSCIAVTASFSMLNFWIANLGALTCITFLFHKRDKLRFSIQQLIFTVILAGLLYLPLTRLIRFDKLYYGGTDNFYSDTLVSLTKYSQYTSTAGTTTHVILIALLILLFIGVFRLIKLNKTTASLQMQNIVLIVLMLSVLSTILQHYLFGTLYLIDRTALLYYPLFIIVLVSCISLYGKVLRSLLFTALIVLFGINFFTNANTFKTVLWSYDCRSKEILELLNDTSAAQNSRTSLDFSWPFTRALEYYAAEQKYAHLELLNNKEDRDAVNDTADYYLYLGQSLEKVGYEAELQKVLQLDRDTVLAFPEENIFLFEILNNK